MIGNLSAGAGLICLVAAALMWIIGGRMMPRTTVLLVLAGTAAVTGTWFGERAGGIIGFVDQTITRLTGALLNAHVAGLLAAVAVFILVLHLWRNTVSEWTLLVAVVIPFAVRALPGDIGDGVRATVTAVASAVGWIVGAPFGLA